jgi:YihY family inner membrane protein
MPDSTPEPVAEIVQEPTLAAATAKNRIAALPPGSWEQIRALGRYLLQTEVHTYAFSVAANTILSLFPFTVLMFTIARVVFHSPQMESVVGDVLRSFLPANAETQDWIVQHMVLLPHKKVQIFSLIALLITSTGVFLPLEVALNRIWGVHKDRSYLKNQIISLGLAFSVGVLAMISVAFSEAQQRFLGWIFFGHTQNIFYRFITTAFLDILATATGVVIFFLIYWILPNRKIPPRAVLPAAVVAGLLWGGARMLYIVALPWLDFQAMYGPFYISVGLMMWAFLSGLILLAGAQFSAVRYGAHEESISR